MRYLIMSGESRVTLPLAFSRLKWMHTMSPDRLMYDNGNIRRSKLYQESLKGVIFYADVDDKSIEKHNLELALEKNLSSWPNPNVLLRMLNRHDVIKECFNNGFINHKIFNDGSYSEIKKEFKSPFVLKVGNVHRGLGKFLINSEKEFIDNIDKEFTAEPFFTGDSVRVLIVEDEAFGIRVDNDQSWIKNSTGAETYMVDVPINLKTHAIDIAKYFGLELAGVDYIIDSSGKFHFLEINQYPGFYISDEVEDVVKKFFNKKMDYIEGF